MAEGVRTKQQESLSATFSHKQLLFPCSMHRQSAESVRSGVFFADGTVLCA